MTYYHWVLLKNGCCYGVMEGTDAPDVMSAMLEFQETREAAKAAWEAGYSVVFVSHPVYERNYLACMRGDCEHQNPVKKQSFWRRVWRELRNG